MPVAAGLPILQSQITNALNMGPAAQQATVATIIASAVASVAPMGFFPPAPVPIPLIPAGMAAGQSMILNGLSMGPAAQQSTVAQMMATGISLIAPTAPPAGMSLLKSQIEGALSMGPAAQQATVATIIATAIASYFPMGGVV